MFASGSSSAAEFTVSGETDATYAITLPSSAVTITDSSSNTLDVTSFTDDTSGTGTLTLGTDTFNVGATVTILDSSVAGSYTGTFDVTVEYN